jgi:hypothetical protein
MTLSAASFYSRIAIAANGCHLWTGYVERYARVKVRGKSYSAHRIAWELARGPIPEGLYVLHRCDNGACVNPDHLFLGDQFDNMRDMRAKGRSNYLQGAAKPNAKLSDGAVRAIRAAAHDAATRKRLAEHYGVTIRTVCNIQQQRHRWKHV